MSVVVRRLLSACAVAVTGAVLFGPAAPAYADHEGNALSSPVRSPASNFLQSQGDWRFIGNYTLGPGAAHPLGVDVTPFSRGSKRYLLVSSTSLGFRIFDVTNPNNPTWVSDYGSAVGCATAIPPAFLDDPSDIFAAASGWENDSTVNQLDADGVVGRGRILGDGTIAVIGTDAGGRCHDGVQGGMEIVDISDVSHPRLMWLTRQTGENHNTSFDPWNNVLITDTTDSNALVDVLDLNGCRSRAEGGKGLCRVREVRYQFPKGLTADSTGGDGDGCHDLTVTKGRWLCAAVTGTVIFDSTHLRRPNGELTGSTLPCPTTTADPATAGGRPIVSDCQLTMKKFRTNSMHNADLRPIAVIHHRPGTDPKTGGYDVSHQAELIRGKGVLMVNDENGGGLTGAGCPGGGVGFFDVRPTTLGQARRDKLGIPQAPFLALADARGRIVRDGAGKPRPAVYLIDRYPPGQQANPSCTSHVFKQWGAQNRAFIAWYFGGGHAFDWRLNLTGKTPSVRFISSAYESLIGDAGAQQSWTTLAYRARSAGAGRTTYWVVNADIVRGVDFMAVTLGKPPSDFPSDGRTDNDGSGRSGPPTSSGPAGHPSEAGGLAKTGADPLWGRGAVALLIGAAALHLARHRVAHGDRDARPR